MMCSKMDPCLYWKRIQQKLVDLCLYVDDILATAQDDALADELMLKLIDNKDMGTAEECMGV